MMFVTVTGYVKGLDSRPPVPVAESTDRVRVESMTVTGGTPPDIKTLFVAADRQNRPHAYTTVPVRGLPL